MPTSTKTQPLVIECAWEVCNQVGGIYTVIRSKTPAMINKYGDDYILFGPYLDNQIQAELDFAPKRTGPVDTLVKRLNKKGWKIHDASWLITGRPRVLLFDINTVPISIDEIRYKLSRNHKIKLKDNNKLVDQALAFGYMVQEFLVELTKMKNGPQVVAHFHEWQSGVPLMFIKKRSAKLKTVFTTHATILGRYLAINSPQFYNHLPFFNSEKEAKHFGIESEVQIEYQAAQRADIFSTVSEVTARECKHLLKRVPDVILPNGLNIKRFVALHEFQNLHQHFKEEIHQFVMGHFFQAYSFNLDNTLYFFTSGRYEYKNKGFDITLDALNLLNKKMIEEQSEMTVVMFYITRRPNHGIISRVLESKGVMEEIRQNCEAIKDQVGRNLFNASTTNEDHRLPNLNEFVDDYWRLRYRRTIQSWKTNVKPSLVTHYIDRPTEDEVLNQLDKIGLDNGPDQRVKIVYHPEFISTTNPLFGIEYHEFVRGCHLGVFPSYYEPWGYTPLECMASGVPSITSDLSGFGDYVLNNVKEHTKKGVWVLERGKREYRWSVRNLAKAMHEFINLSRRERIMQRNNTENSSIIFDWNNLITHYEEAYKLAFRKKVVKKSTVKKVIKKASREKTIIPKKPAKIQANKKK